MAIDPAVVVGKRSAVRWSTQNGTRCMQRLI